MYLQYSYIYTPTIQRTQNTTTPAEKDNIETLKKSHCIEIAVYIKDSFEQQQILTK